MENSSVQLTEVRESLKALLLEKSVRTGTFTLASGKESDLYIDCRVTGMDPRGARMIGKVGSALVSEKMAEMGVKCDSIGGMTLGADPISLAVGMASAELNEAEMLQVFTVRKEAKEHGRGKRIEGNFAPGQKIVVVDDVITTGGSTVKAIEAIREAGGEVVFAFVLVDREEGGRAAIEAAGIPVVSAFTRSELLAE